MEIFCFTLGIRNMLASNLLEAIFELVIISCIMQEIAKFVSVSRIKLKAHSSNCLEMSHFIYFNNPFKG